MSLIAIDGAGDGLRDAPKVDVTDIVIIPEEKAPIGDPLSLTINFTLDRDVVAAYWVFKVRYLVLCTSFYKFFDCVLHKYAPFQLLVDSSFKRIIKGTPEYDVIADIIAD